ncbi:hypothetical protein GRI36_13720 [Altererythrobacter gangjinensis]|uniref:EF-hand domain-containing protein n=1 Tax=Pontixanthobacter gangjinensis TaxID=1028742 RepID=A0A6I4SS42_9SPHN|nr:hypothetical protein [Pontixanthobacter gangjinensis]
MSTPTTLDQGDGDVDNNYGADGPGSVIFTAATIAALEGQGLTSGFADLEYTISANGTVITATKSTDNTEVFKIELQPTGSADQYKVSISQPIDSTSEIAFNSNAYDFTGGNNSWNGFVEDGESLGGIVIDNDSLDLLLTPAIGGANGSSVNTTATIGGIGNAFVGSQSGGETFRVDFVTDLRGDTADTVGGLNYAAAANRDHNFDGHYTVNGATALIKSTSGSTVKITAFDDPDGNLIVGDGVIDTISGVTIEYKGVAFGGVIIPTTTPTDYSVNGQTFTVTLNGNGSVSVAGVEGESGASLLGTVIGVFTEDGYNSVEYSWEAGSTFQVGDFGATSITNDPVNFTVPISIVDGDGDVVDAGILDITATPAVVPIVLDLDGDGAEFLGLDAGVTYNYGNGFVATAWVGADDGLLARATDDGLDITFADDAAGAKTDLEGLAMVYDSNGDAVFDANDVAFSEFGVWQDADSDGVVDAGEFVSLSDAGIISISLSSDEAQYSAADGDVIVHGTGSYTNADGTHGLLADASFATSATDRGLQRTTAMANVTAAAGAYLISETAMAGVAAPAMASEPVSLMEYSDLDQRASVTLTDVDAERSTALESVFNFDPSFAQRDFSRLSSTEGPFEGISDPQHQLVNQAEDQLQSVDRINEISSNNEHLNDGLNEALMHSLLSIEVLELAAQADPAGAQGSYAYSEAIAELMDEQYVNSIVEHFADAGSLVGGEDIHDGGPLHVAISSNGDPIAALIAGSEMPNLIEALSETAISGGGSSGQFVFEPMALQAISEDLSAVGANG